MATSRVLRTADALAEVIRGLIPGGMEAEVTRTYHGRRFDAAKTIGLKVYVVPREDVEGDRESFGDRSQDPMEFTYSIVVAKRLPSELRDYDVKDLAVDCLVDLTTTLRDRLKDPRSYELTTGVQLYPVETGVREVCDLAQLNEDGVFVSEFTNTIREV